MIKKRQPKQESVSKPIQETKQQRPKPNNKPVNKEFKTYREEACYVLDLLEKQGVNIYEEGRYGGMYLNRHSGAKISHIFSETNNKKQNNNQQVNNSDSNIDNNDLIKLFGIKK